MILRQALSELLLQSSQPALKRWTNGLRSSRCNLQWPCSRFFGIVPRCYCFASNYPSSKNLKKQQEPPQSRDIKRHAKRHEAQSGTLERPNTETRARPTDHKASPKLLSPQNKIVPTRFSLKVTLRPEIHISPELIFQEVKTSLERMVPLSHSKSCIFIFAPQRKHQVYAFPKMIFPLNQYFVKKNAIVS